MLDSSASSTENRVRYRPRQYQQPRRSHKRPGDQRLLLLSLRTSFICTTQQMNTIEILHKLLGLLPVCFIHLLIQANRSVFATDHDIQCRLTRSDSFLQRGAGQPIDLRNSLKSTLPKRCPSTETVPLVGQMYPLIIFKMVVFPEPFSPRTAQCSPCCTVQSTPVRTVFCSRCQVTLFSSIVVFITAPSPSSICCVTSFLFSRIIPAITYSSIAR